MEFAEILQNDVKDPRIRRATCTRVQVSGDLKVAKIYFSVLGEPEMQKATLNALDRASGYVRRLLGQRLDLRVVPEIRFVFDPSVEYGIRLEQLLDEIHPPQGEEPESEP